MPKALYIAEKPSVAQEFARALKMDMKRHDGYQEGAGAVVTWCVGHLVTMSYPEVYDQKYKKWSLSTLPFLPKEFKYEIIPAAAKQFRIVASLLNRKDIDLIYVCTDSGREGNTFTVLWSRWLKSGESSASASGSIPRPRRRSCAASGKPRTCQNMITWRPALICARRKII